MPGRKNIDGAGNVAPLEELSVEDVVATVSCDFGILFVLPSRIVCDAPSPAATTAVSVCQFLPPQRYVAHTSFADRALWECAVARSPPPLPAPSSHVVHGINTRLVFLPCVLPHKPSLLVRTTCSRRRLAMHDAIVRPTTDCARCVEYLRWV